MFKVHFKKSVENDLKTLVKADQKRMLEQIGKVLAQDHDEGKALSGEFKGLFRWRAGQFRVIYEIQKDVLTILILKNGHRKDIYCSE
ncbi:MAG: type II toxin-antitoxin system RelE/ParE family toxin [Nitrospirota bacterium]|nr:type II toxin-antitoxin system RelE/ParE family toxin [Nitrospirota bacterium]